TYVSSTDVHGLHWMSMLFFDHQQHGGPAGRTAQRAPRALQYSRPFARACRRPGQTRYGLSTASGARGPSVAASRRDCRATTLVTVRSAVTLPSVANTSGSVSTASIRPSGASGTPIACATGRLVAMKVTWPGRPTEPRLITTASAAPAASCAGPRWMPLAQAMKQAEAMYCTGLVSRHSDTAIGSASAVTWVG